MAVEGAIVLSGSLEDAQATTCGEYFRQTWPTNGQQVFQILKNLAGGSINQKCESFSSVSRSKKNIDDLQVRFRTEQFLKHGFRETSL